MQMFTVHQFVVAALLVLLCSSASAYVGAYGALPQMKFYHRLSPQVKENAQRTGSDWVFPAINTPEYHQFLVHRDLVRHGRNLATVPRTLTFVQGNITVNYGALYYTLIVVGTPSVSYFVALDTGSDLFWLPCECKACAPASSPSFAGLPSLNIYAPSQSSSSKVVTCSSSKCSSIFSTCGDLSLPNSAQCQYGVVYGSPNTTTSGTVYEDNIHLTPNTGTLEDITSPIILGCGQIQTGSLVDGSGVPDGLMGLGRQPFSVPSLLAQSGLVGDSFSMCFSTDGSGRIVFGDFGSSAITSTPLQESSTSKFPQYRIGLVSIEIGNDSIPVNEVILFDTGTTVTFLTSAVYKAVIASFVGQVINYKRTVFDGYFDACYLTSNYEVDVPKFTFDLSGGATFKVIAPFVPYFSQNSSTLVGFCLAILDGGTMSIFGANFMLGYNFVFNRQDLTLGFEPSSCYTDDTATGMSPTEAPARAPIPSSGATPPDTVAVPPTSVNAIPGPRQGSAAQRTSVPLLSIFLVGLIVNFVLY